MRNMYNMKSKIFVYYNEILILIRFYENMHLLNINLLKLEFINLLK